MYTWTQSAYIHYVCESEGPALGATAYFCTIAVGTIPIPDQQQLGIEGGRVIEK